MTVPIELHVNGLAGHATLSIRQPHGNHTHTLLSVMLGPAEIQQLIDRLTDVVGGPAAPTAPVLIRRDPIGLWVFTCHNHDGPPVRGRYFEHHRAVTAAHRHATVNHRQETSHA